MKIIKNSYVIYNNYFYTHASYIIIWLYIPIYILHQKPPCLSLLVLSQWYLMLIFIDIIIFFPFILNQKNLGQII